VHREEDPVIELYSAATPNGQKIHIMLEETGLPYTVHWVDIDRGEQFEPEFLKISPNNKIPAIVDHEAPGGAPFAVFESGAILIYLADKTGRFLPTEPLARSLVLQWLMFQMGSVGPMLGQAHHFRAYTREKIAYAFERYTNEAGRIYGILDGRLAEHQYLAGDYSIADMATFPWIRLHGRQGQDLDRFPGLKRWFEEIARRPAVAKDMERLEDVVGEIDDETWSNLWGAEQYKRR
jgi:GST-like protein